jgi:GNAT superfamily N-acetyltransferase
MEIDRGNVALKNGETAQLRQIVAPEPGWRERCLPFLAHKGHTWMWAMETAFDDAQPGMRTSFFVCLLDGEIVGNITTVEALARPVGMLQHVYTNPDHRRKGICQALMQVLVADFVARGGRAMFLGTGYDSPPFWIYHSFGFRPIGETGSMRWLPDEDFAASYFAPGEVSVRDTVWPDWPCLDALYRITEGWYLRGCAFSQYGHSSFEGAYPNMMEGLREGHIVQVKVLAKADGAVMGHAMITTMGQWPGRPYLLDFFVHPNFEDQAVKLLQGLDLPVDRKVHCFSDAEAPGRMTALEAAGFQQEAVLKDQLRRGDDGLDVRLYSRW